MTNESFLLFGSLFGLSIVIMAMVAMMSESRWRFVTLPAVALSFLCVYAGLDQFLGTPKPVGVNPGWHDPVLGKDGATVEGVELGDQIFLTLKEGSGPPRLYNFGNDPELRRLLKQAMDAHAKKANGNPLGFKVMEGGKEGKASGQGEGTGGAYGEGSIQASGQGEYSRFHFEEPKAAALPPKDQAG